MIIDILSSSCVDDTVLSKGVVFGLSYFNTNIFSYSGARTESCKVFGGNLKLILKVHRTFGFTSTHRDPHKLGLHVYAAFYLPLYQHREETEASLN